MARPASCFDSEFYIMVRLVSSVMFLSMLTSSLHVSPVKHEIFVPCLPEADTSI